MPDPSLMKAMNIILFVVVKILAFGCCVMHNQVRHLFLGNFLSMAFKYDRIDNFQ